MAETSTIGTNSTGCCLSQAANKIGRASHRTWRAIKQFDRDATQKVGHGGMGLIWLSLSALFIAHIAYAWSQLPVVDLNYNLSEMSTYDQFSILTTCPFTPICAFTYGIPIAGVWLGINNLRVALFHPSARSPEIDNPEFSKNSKDEEANL